MCESNLEQQRRQQTGSQTLVIPMLQEVFEEADEELLQREPEQIQKSKETITEETQTQQLDRVSLSELGITREIPKETAPAQDLNQTSRLQKMSWKERQRANRVKIAEKAKLEKMEKKEKTETARSLFEKERMFKKQIKNENGTELKGDTFDARQEEINEELRHLTEYDLSNISTESSGDFIESYSEIKNFIHLTEKAERLMKQNVESCFLSKAIKDNAEMYIRYGAKLKDYANTNFKLLTDKTYLAHSREELDQLEKKDQKELGKKQREYLDKKQKVRDNGFQKDIPPKILLGQIREEMIGERRTQQQQVNKHFHFISKNYGAEAFFNNKSLDSREVPRLQKAGRLNALDRWPTRLSYLQGIYANRTGTDFFEEKAPEEIEKIKRLNLDMQKEFSIDNPDKVCQLIAETGKGILKQKIRRNLNSQSPDYINDMIEFTTLVSSVKDFDQSLKKTNIKRVRELLGEDDYKRMEEYSMLANGIGEASTQILKYMQSPDYLSVGEEAKEKEMYQQYSTYQQYLGSDYCGSNSKDSKDEIYDKNLNMPAHFYFTWLSLGANKSNYDNISAGVKEGLKKGPYDFLNQE